MRNIKKHYAFTLVELIIVVVILAILATIAFLSFHKYSSNSRDSVRLSDVSSINKSLEIYNVNAGLYPDPDDISIQAVYAGGIILKQGIISERLALLGGFLNKQPIDPLNMKPYPYSVNAINSKFEVRADLENGDYSSYNFDLFNFANAANTGSTFCFIKGNFNGLVEKTKSGNEESILTLPGLMLYDSDITEVGNVEYNYLSGLIQHNGFTYPCITNYVPKVVLTSSGFDLSNNTGAITQFVNDLKDSYNGSNISNTPAVSSLLSVTGSEVLNYGSTLVKTFGLNNSASVQASMPQILINCNNGVALTGNKLFYNNSTTYSFTGTSSTPTNLGYSVAPLINTCNWKCSSGYHEDGGSCVSDGVSATSVTVNVSGADYSYNIKQVTGKNGYSKYWTVGTLKHPANVGRTWCYQNNPALCNSEGRLYDRRAANNACTLMGVGWHIPTLTDWNNFIKAGANGWTGNKLLGLVSNLPGLVSTKQTFYSRGLVATYWSSTESNSSYVRRGALRVGNASLLINTQQKIGGMSLLCTKD